MRKISVVIPTYNGKYLLEEYLSSLKAALEFYPGDSEIIIVDNGSVDESVLFLNQNYPEARIIKNSVNEGFGPAINKGVREAKYDIVLLLNNDIGVEHDFIAPLVRHFDDPAVFAVVSKSLVTLVDRIANESITVPGFDGGLFFCHQPFILNDKEDINIACTNFHASGGFGAFDRRKFLELGGFDDIFHPFYYEDVDLSYQAWKRGWQVLYEPNSVVHHRSHATSSKVASDKYISRIELRNRILLTWKNISDPTLVVRHIKWVFGLLAGSFRPSKKHEIYIVKVMLSALRRLPAVISYRIKNAKFVRLSDSRIFDLAVNKDTPNLKFDRLLSEAPEQPLPGLKILLIDPIGYQKGLNVGLAYLAGALKQSGYNNVDVLDLNNVFYDIPDARIIEFIKKRGYDIIGFSIKTPTFYSASKVAKLIKQQYPQASLMAGGPHITLNYNEFMVENSEFDYAVVGEGDESVVELCRMFESGREYPIVGIYSRKQGCNASFSPRLVDRLDVLPLPDYDVFNGYDFTNFEYLLVTSRGCPYKCTYCSVRMISGNKMRYRDVDNVIAELKWAKEKFNCTKFNIVDDNFTLHVKRAKQFCDRLIEEELAFTWACGNGIRADKVDAELAQKMKKSGCNLVCVGVESADPVVFESIKKGETLDDIKRGVHLLKDAGIEVVGFFIIGLPGDTSNSSEMALKFVKEAGLDSARFGILLPYPNTEAYDILVKTGTFLKDYKDGIHFSDKLSPVFETKVFSAAEMVETYEKLYTRLRYFTFLLPLDITAIGKIKKISKLIWKYDKLGFIKERIKAIPFNRLWRKKSLHIERGQIATIDIEKEIEPARGYFDRVEYIDGNLTIDGWMFVVAERADKFSLFIDKQFVREFDIIENASVAKAFQFIPHAGYSGFSISEKSRTLADGMVEICIVAMNNEKQIGHLQTCYSKKAADKFIVRDKHLMQRVVHSVSVLYFRASGFKSFYDFWGPACKYSDSAELKTVLDWGCGCGRLIEMFDHLTENKELFGCDIDSEAINWCMNNLENVKFNIIPPLPPTEYPDNFFDLVIGNSVFTHLTRDVQFLWLEELNRIIKRDGLLLATVQGECAAFFQFQDKSESILNDGIFDESIDDTIGNIAPKNYYRSTFQSQKYTKREFGKYFEVLDYIEKGSSNFQDLVVMRKNLML